MKRRDLTLALSWAVLSAACGSDDPSLAGPSATPAEIVGVTWRLTELAPAGESASAPPAGTFTLELLPGGALAAVADCNRCAGDYLLGQATLEVEGGVLACTRAFCASSPFDSDFVRVLAGVRTWEGGASTLTLAGDPGVLRFERAAP